MRELGILFRPNFALGGSIGVNDLLKDGYDAVFIGTGTWRPRSMNIPGETYGMYIMDQLPESTGRI